MSRRRRARRAELGADRIPADFPAAQLVVPKAVTLQAPRTGVEVHAQLFERAGGGPAKKPAIVYVHGGPPRQMLLGWNYSDYYANAYAINQYLASRGFVVLSVNYRLGHRLRLRLPPPAEAGAQGASEYLDVKAAAEYLRALAAGRPVAHRHLRRLLRRISSPRWRWRATRTSSRPAWTSTACTTSRPGTRRRRGARSRRCGRTALETGDREKALEVAWQSSPVSSVPTWRSPVLLIHGDDDRNVRFSQTVDLVRRLEAQGSRSRNWSSRTTPTTGCATPTSSA